MGLTRVSSYQLYMMATYMIRLSPIKLHRKDTVKRLNYITPEHLNLCEDALQIYVRSNLFHKHK